MKQEQKSQLQQANEQLIGLGSDVTTNDRQEAMNTYSEFTVYQYLKGRGKSLDTAIKLLQFFKKRIEDRNKVLS